MTMQRLERTFKSGDIELSDLDPTATPEEIMEMYSKKYPSLTNGEIGGPYYEDEKEKYKLEGKGPTARYELKGSYGTKG